jgi:hypothetical protein
MRKHYIKSGDNIYEVEGIPSNVKKLHIKTDKHGRLSISHHPEARLKKVS